jgi:broad specificity phosphatase PhoE
MSQLVIKRSVTWCRHGESEQYLLKYEKVGSDADQLAQFKLRDTGNHRLTLLGVGQGEQAGKILRSVGSNFSLLVTSTYVRAIETLLATGFEGAVEVTPLLDERSVGDLETVLSSEFYRLYPDADSASRYKETRWRPPNGESMRDVLVRVLLFVEHLKTLDGGDGHVLCITHSRVMASYMWWAEQLENHEVPGTANTADDVHRNITNGQIIQYGWEDGRRSLRPTHVRYFAPTQDIDLEWRPLPLDAKFTVSDLRRMVDRYSRIIK